MNIRFPLAKETINDADIDALCDWLKSYPRLTKGQLTWQVEDAWASFIGTKHAVFNNSGSSANLLMIYAAMQAGRIKNKKIVGKPTIVYFNCHTKQRAPKTNREFKITFNMIVTEE